MPNGLTAKKVLLLLVNKDAHVPVAEIRRRACLAFGSVSVETIEFDGGRASLFTQGKPVAETNLTFR